MGRTLAMQIIFIAAFVIEPLIGHHDIRMNDIQPNETNKHNIYYNDTQQKDTQEYIRQ